MLATNRSRGVYATAVDRYICLTEFARERFVRGGLPAKQLVVRANALMNAPQAGSGSGGYALFVGRLGQEKGIATLLRAWQGIEHLSLRIVGEGPLGATLRQQAAGNPLVEFLGFRQRSEVFELMRDATMLIIPSECYEGFPVTAMEGMASGTPMIVSAIGALDEILDAPSQCLKFPPGNAEALRTSVLSLSKNPALLQSMRESNRSIFDSRYSPAQALRSLMDIYESAIAERNTVGTKSPLRMPAQSPI
jgi:glycosyltransferase involved in cell wall biosynthesis